MPGNGAARFLRFGVPLLLAAAVAAIYWRTGSYPFLPFDDRFYVHENPEVLKGLTFEGIAWAFRTTHAANWHPLTWISHMADVEMFGLDAGLHHLVNVLLHGANSILLYFLIRRLAPGWDRQAAFAAALFAVHPLHVESVAWVAERKDLLCAFFVLLALWGYAGYAARGGLLRYAAVALPFALALLSKPMAVTLPFLLLVLDFWPLRRSGTPSALLLEKVPLILLSLASAGVTLAAQAAGGAVVSGEVLSPLQRVANALLSYVAYLGKTAWPSSLAVYYPLGFGAEGELPWLKGLLALALVASVSVAAVRLRRSRPYLLAGWCWYLGTLVPVIGFVQAGLQSMADRYMYLPMVGLSIMVAGAGGELAEAGERLRKAVAAVALAVLLVLSVTACRQVEYWRDEFALFGHALEVTEGNWVVNQSLGIALEKAGNEAEAARRYAEALRIYPFAPAANFNLGLLYLKNDLPEDARERFLAYGMTAPGDPMAAAYVALAEEKIARRNAGAATPARPAP